MNDTPDMDDAQRPEVRGVRTTPRPGSAGASLARRRVLWLTSVIALAAAVWLLWREVDWAALDARAIADRVHAAGPIGPIALFALLVLQCVVSPLPSEPLMMAAGFLYGPWVGFTLAWSAVVLGATLCFMMARTLGRSVVERFVSSEKLASFDASFVQRGEIAAFFGVLAIRLFAHGSFDVVSYACGLVPFRLPMFLVASGAGVVPKVLAFTYLGASTGSRPAWLDALILAGTFGMLLLVPLWWRSRRAPPPQTASEGTASGN